MVLAHCDLRAVRCEEAESCGRYARISEIHKYLPAVARARGAEFKAGIKKQRHEMVNTYPAANATLPLRGAPVIRHIILPLDGGKRAEMAVDPATALARAFGADVILVRCFELDEHTQSAHTALTLPANKPHLPLHMASLYLAHIEERIRARGIDVHSHLYQWPVGSSTRTGAQHYADALVVITVQTGAVDVPHMCGVVADISDGARPPILFIPADGRSPLAGGHLRGLHTLAVSGDEAPAVTAYARILADALHGTTVDVSSHPSSKGHDETSAMSDVTSYGWAIGNAVHDIHQYIAHVGAEPNVVVLPAAACLRGSQHADTDGCAFSEALSAGVALLLVS